MLENRKPRHIRDIAHLYISRPQARTEAPTVSVCVAAENKRCIPGFHVANIAAALSVKNCPVRVLDRSGLLPNVGYYMSLNPARYIRRAVEGAGLTAGMAGVEIDCCPEGPRVVPQAFRYARVELVHLPPLSHEDRFEEAAREMKKRTGTVGILLILRVGPADESGRAGALAAELGPAATFSLVLAELHSGRAAEPVGPWAGAPGTVDLGRIVDWERALDDRVPPVIRSPGSALAQTYRSVSEALLFKVNDLGRKQDASRVGVSSGIGSRPHHR